MVSFAFSFSWELAALVIALVVCFTILFIVKLYARDSRTQLAIDLGDLKGRMANYEDAQRSMRYEISELSKRLKLLEEARPVKKGV